MTGSINKVAPTGFCWNCGMPASGLFYKDVCQRKYERMHKKQQEDAVKEGHRRAYGLKGSTH